MIYSDRVRFKMQKKIILTINFLEYWIICDFLWSDGVKNVNNKTSLQISSTHTTNRETPTLG